MSTQQEAEAVPVPDMVYAGVERGKALRRRLYLQRTSTHAQAARYMGRIAATYEREARWWDVLALWTFHPLHGVSFVYGDAAIVAKAEAQRFARSYREMEADSWQRSLAVASDSGVAA